VVAPCSARNPDSGIWEIFAYVIHIILGFGIRYAALGFRYPTNSDWNPESKFHLQGLESSTWNPESKAWNPESKIVLVPLTWGENGFMKRQVLFFNGRKEL